MEVLKVCRICLVMDVNMYDLRTQPLETYFELVIGNLLNSTELPPFACFQCAALLKKFYYFREKCLKGQSILYGILQSSGKITEEELQQINRPSNLTVHEIPQNNIIRDIHDENSVLIIKKEPAIEDDIRIVKIEGNVKKEDYCSNLLLCQSTSEDEFEGSTKEECFDDPAVLSTENVESLSLQTNNKEKKTKEKKKCKGVKKKDTVDPLEDNETDIYKQNNNMSSSEESDIDMQSTPSDILNEAQIAENGLLPAKSQERYLMIYNNFISWKTRRNTQSFSENVLMAYFNELRVKYKPSSMWSMYSMLKSTLKTNNDIDLTKYRKLHLFLKQQSDGYTSKKSKVFTAANVEKFLNDAPDEKYLGTKAIFIFGISGACRRQELVNINVSDIENHGDLLLVKIPDTKTKIPRTFTIHGEFYAIVKKYQALRITNAKSNRFFQKYQNGKCMRQVIGVNKIGSVPKEIATFLKLEDAASYTGHSFRRTSATLLTNSGADIITLKRYGAWRSNNFTKGYIEDSVHNKIETGDKISKCININNAVEPRPSTSRENVQPPPSPPPPPSSPTFTPHSPT